MLISNRAIILTIILITFLHSCLSAQQNPEGMALRGTAKVQDKFTPVSSADVAMQGGMLGARIAVNEKARLRNVDENDMLDAFEHRLAPHQDWQGEHVGKFLHAGTLAWANTGDTLLKTKLDRVVERLLKTQEADGYLGTYKPDHRWSSWDVWVHKYDLIGLLTYNQYTHKLPGEEKSASLSRRALIACRRVGDLLIHTFGTAPGQRDINKSGEHVGMAPDSVLESIVLLYRATNDPRYLAFARYIVSNYDAPGGPAILASLEKNHTVRKVANAKAYEMTSNFNGLLELYRATGEKRLFDDMQIAWDDIVKNRLYLTGSASSYELYQDNFQLPNGNRANICETCVTVTWEQMNLELLRLTGDPKYADEAERSIYNHLLAAQKPTGDDWVYYTPLEGHKQYDSFTTCCHSSGPRGIALIPSFTVMTSEDGGVVINLYNSGHSTVHLKSGKLSIQELTDYPYSGEINLQLDPAKNGASFPLMLRIPGWTSGAKIELNGKPLTVPAVPGSYLTINRVWKRGDTIKLTIALPTRFVPGSHENAGKAAIIYGPLVLALDIALNPRISNLNRVELAAVSQNDFKLAKYNGGVGESLRAVHFVTDGKISSESSPITLQLIPFAEAGQDGKSRYEIWIPTAGHGNASAMTSLFEGGRQSFSRAGNNDGEINDGDLDTFRVTYNNTKQDEDWFAVFVDKPVIANTVVFAHGRVFHDGGWFDTSAGKPTIQVQTETRGEWKTVAAVDSYPQTTAINSAHLKDGETFTVKFNAMKIVAIRIIGKPASGDNVKQSFSSCAELQAFYK